MFGVVNLTKNADFDKYKHSGYGIGFDSHEIVLLSDGSGFGKSVTMFVAGIYSSPNVDNRKKEILIMGKGPTQVLEDNTFIAEKECVVNFSEQQDNFF